MAAAAVGRVERREAVGINSATIPLTQMDLADAAGLSAVHINRTFQELRKLGVLSKSDVRSKSWTGSASSAWPISTAIISTCRKCSRAGK